MQVDISIHDAKGEIIRIISCPHTMVNIQELPSDGGYIDGSWDGRYWRAIGDEAFPRPEMSCTLDKPSIAADGIEESALSGLPLPCLVTLSGPVNSSVEMEETDPDSLPVGPFDVPGTYRVKVAAWPYLDKEFAIEAA